MHRILYVAISTLIVLLATVPSEARPRHSRPHHHLQKIDRLEVIVCNQWGCNERRRLAPQLTAGASIRVNRYQTAIYDDARIVGHPPGCPRTAFCGCGVSVKVFGRPVRHLFLAANWYKFPRTRAASGMVAIFGRHHVAYIQAVDGNGNATLYDPNSGGHKTRIHTRNIAGATVVNPNG